MGCCENRDTKCCTPAPAADVREKVRAGYAKIAQTGMLSTPTAPRGGGCCGGETSKLSAEELARKIGYSPEQIRGLPEIGRAHV
jgi:hypothetical protein